LPLNGIVENNDLLSGIYIVSYSINQSSKLCRIKMQVVWL